MKVTNSTIAFTFERKKYHAQVSRFQPAGEMMHRVVVDTPKNPEQVFVFYERKTKNGDLFWYDLADEQEQAMAEVIAEKLLE